MGRRGDDRGANPGSRNHSNFTRLLRRLKVCEQKCAKKLKVCNSTLHECIELAEIKKSATVNENSFIRITFREPRGRD